MAAIFHQMNDTYWSVVESGDVRSSKYPLVSSPTAMALTIVLYMSFTQFGPRYFANKKPLDIKPIIILYNFFMVLISVYMLKEFVVCAYLIGYNMICQPMDKSLSPTSMRMVHVCYLFYITKMLELADTVFMVIRKKGQLSFLHVFHHSTVIFDQWTFIKFYPSSHAFFQATFNCFVHSIMYLYYFLACFPHLKKYLWWKKYLTQIQMIQFVLVIAHTTSGLVVACDFPRWGLILCLSECSILLLLFANYYIQTHLKKRKENLKKIG